MARLYAGLSSYNGSCRRCRRPGKLFGLRDAETGWESWCSVCNAEWKMNDIMGKYRCCSRACSIASPVPCGMGISLAGAVLIESYLFIDGPTKHAAVMRRHRCKLDLLEWTSARLDWFLADDSSEELEPDDPPTLQSLRHWCVRDMRFGPFARRRIADFNEMGPTLLEAIHSYLTPSLQSLSSLRYHQHYLEVSWEIFQYDGKLWLWNNCTGESFFVDGPPSHWRRYCWFAGYPRTSATIFYWWHNCVGEHWFVEPLVSDPDRSIPA